MFCEKCGKENINGAKFCKGCGSLLSTDITSSAKADEYGAANNVNFPNNRSAAGSGNQPASSMGVMRKKLAGEQKVFAYILIVLSAISIILSFFNWANTAEPGLSGITGSDSSALAVSKGYSVFGLTADMGPINDACKYAKMSNDVNDNFSLSSGNDGVLFVSFVSPDTVEMANYAKNNQSSYFSSSKAQETAAYKAVDEFQGSYSLMVFVMVLIIISMILYVVFGVVELTNVLPKYSKFISLGASAIMFIATIIFIFKILSTMFNLTVVPWLVISVLIANAGLSVIAMKAKKKEDAISEASAK